MSLGFQENKGSKGILDGCFKPWPVNPVASAKGAFKRGFCNFARLHHKLLRLADIYKASRDDVGSRNEFSCRADRCGNYDKSVLGKMLSVAQDY